MEKILERATMLKYNSLDYVDLEDLEGARLLIDTEDAIFLYRKSDQAKELYWEAKEGNNLQLFWAADSAEAFLCGLRETISRLYDDMQELDKLYMEFIPEELVPDMESMGFAIASEWVDYWKMDLSSVQASPAGKVVVRQLKTNETAVAAAVARSCTGMSRGFVGQTDELMAEWMDSEHSCIFAAEIDGKVIGIGFFKLYGFDNEKGTVLWVRELAVSPAHQKKGIGRQLVLQGLQWGVSHGAKRSFLACDVENYGAIQLYESLGYSRKEERGQINMDLCLKPRKPGNKGVNYDRMVKSKSGDELGLFEKYEETLEKVRARVMDAGAQCVMDFGCGTGNLCGPLSGKIKVIGIDKNLEMIAEGKRKFPKMEFVDESILDITKIQKQADVVVSSYVLHGLTEDEKRLALSGMRRLAKDGRIILADLMFESRDAKQQCKDRLLASEKQELWEFLESKHYFIVAELKKQLDKLGLQAEFEHVGNFTWIVDIQQ